MSIALRKTIFLCYHRNWLEPLHFLLFYFSNSDTVRKNFCVWFYYRSFVVSFFVFFLIKRTWRAYTSFLIRREMMPFSMFKYLIEEEYMWTRHVKIYCKHAKSNTSLLYSLSQRNGWWLTGGYMFALNLIYDSFDRCSHINLFVLCHVVMGWRYYDLHIIDERKCFFFFSCYNVYAPLSFRREFYWIFCFLKW